MPDAHPALKSPVSEACIFESVTAIVNGSIGPCSCDESFTSRNRVDPECYRCNTYADELITELEQFIESLLARPKLDPA